MDLEKISELSKINISKEEEQKYQQDFKKIIALFDEIKDVDTKDIEPLINVSELEQNLREDQSAAFEDTDSIIETSPELVGRLVKVPPVI